MLKSLHGAVVAPHTAPDGIPPTVRKGDRVRLGHRHERWTEYAWCTDASGSSGWVPFNVLDAREGSEATAVQDYSAQELDIQPGDRLRLMWKAGGWWWCENRDGDRGWVPTECVEPEEHPGAA